MSKLRTWGVVALLAVVAIAAGGWFLALSPQKAKVADLHSQAAQQEEANQKLQSQILLLKKQQSQIPAEQARIAEIKGRIPDTPQVTAYVRTLTTLAAATHVELVSIAPSAPALVQLASVQPQTNPAPSTSASTGSAGVSAGAGAPAANLSTISIAINVVGDYYSVQQFLSKLEDGKRIAIVSSLALAPGAPPQATGDTAGGAAAGAGGAGSWKTLSASISASIFMSGAPTTAVPGAAPAAAAATPNASPAASPTSTASASH
jgi:Tfp pilus assembly protein PilO